MKRVCLLGSTGSIGTQTLDVIRALNRGEPRFEIVALAAGENLARLVEQVREFRPRRVAIKRERDLGALEQQLGPLAHEIETAAGEESLSELTTRSGADLVVNALVGAAGLRPTLAALGAGIDVALANKESLVIGGHLVQEARQRSGAQLLPVDSEHSALYQLLQAHSRGDVARLVLTASGGALRAWPLDELERATAQDVLKHPTWHMGPRITVDSATLVNKAFEVIEAHWLFELPYDRIDVTLHPQSIVHGMVELRDGSVFAHLGSPDMRAPIQYALTYPSRPTRRFGRVNWRALELEFSSLDEKRYPAFGVVVAAGRRGGTAPAVANAADEALVEAFLEGAIPFARIASAIREALEAHEVVERPALEEVLQADRWARAYARRLLLP